MFESIKWQFFDMCGMNIGVNYQGYSRSKSISGIIITGFMFIILIWAMAGLLSNMTSRDQPYSSFSRNYIESSEKMIINEDNFVIAFGLQDPTSLQHYKDEQIYSVEAIHRKTTRERDINGQIITSSKDTMLSIEACDSSNFGKLGNDFLNLGLSDLYCLKQEQPNLSQLTILGASDSDSYESIVINIKKCTSGTCATTTEIEDSIRDGFFTVYFIDTAINITDHDIPNKTFKNSISTNIRPEAYKKLNLFLKRMDVITDTGSFGTSNNYKQFVGYDYNTENGNFQAQNTIITMQVGASSFLEVYHRRYAKLPDVIAQIYCLVSVVFLIIFLVFYPYLRLKFYEEVINTVFGLRGLTYLKSKSSSKQSQAKHRNPYLMNQQKAGNSSYTETEESPEKQRKINRAATLTPFARFNFKFKRREIDDTTGDIELKLKPTIQKDELQYKRTLRRPLTMNPLTPKASTKELPKINVASPKSARGSSTKFFPKDRPASEQAETLKRRYFSSESNFLPSNLSKVGLAIYKSKTKANFMQSTNPDEFRLTDKSMSLLLPGPTEDQDFNKTTTMFDENKDNSRIFDEPQKSPTNKQRTLFALESPSKANTGPIIRNFFKPGGQSQHASAKDIVVVPVEKTSESKIRQPETPSPTEDLSNEGLNISLKEYVKNIFKKTDEFKDKYSTLASGIKKVQSLLDIVNIIERLSEVEMLKTLIMDRDQLMLFNNIPKLKIDKAWSQNEISSIDLLVNRDVGLMDRAYHNLSSRKKKNEIDQKLIDFFKEYSS